MNRIIPDRATAAKLGARAVDAGEAVTFTVFSYPQPRTNLTLYGAALLLRDGSEREVRFQ